MAGMRYGMSLTVQPDCLKCRVVSETVFGDMHLKDLLGSIARVGYYILFPDLSINLHNTYLLIRLQDTVVRASPLTSRFRVPRERTRWVSRRSVRHVKPVTCVRPPPRPMSWRVRPASSHSGTSLCAPSVRPDSSVPPPMVLCESGPLILYRFSFIDFFIYKLSIL